MKNLLKILLSVALLFSWPGMGQKSERKKNPARESGTEQESQEEQEPYLFQHVKRRVDLTYQISEYLYFSMKSARNSVEMIWRKPFHEIPLEELFEKSKQGDSVCDLFLAYLYLDERLKTKYVGKYSISFLEKKLTKEEMKSIQSFLQEKPLPYEWSFIEGWLALFSLVNPSSLSAKMKAVQESNFKFLKAKEGKSDEFEFQWAFFIMEMTQHFVFEDSHLREAGHIILTRAREGYAPAQYLQSAIEWNNGNPFAAVEWLQRAYDQNFRRSFSAAIMGLILFGEEDFAKAALYLKSAVYEHDVEFLKPDLLFSYLKMSQLSSAFRVAKEIGENYTRFPPETSLQAIGFLITALANGFGTEQDFEESYIWAERIFLYCGGEPELSGA